MKTITKGLIIVLVLVSSFNLQAQKVAHETGFVANQEIPTKALERFEMRMLKNKKEELLKNQIGKKIISRRRSLHQK
jgi:hypothetical protein